MSNQGNIQRSILPIPDRQYTGLVTYDAKDPDTKFPPIVPLRARWRKHPEYAARMERGALPA